MITEAVSGAVWCGTPLATGQLFVFTPGTTYIAMDPAGLAVTLVAGLWAGTALPDLVKHEPAAAELVQSAARVLAGADGRRAFVEVFDMPPTQYFQYRFVQTPDGEDGLNYLCPSYKVFFHHVDRPMRLMSQLLRQGRAPSEVSALLAAEDEARFADVGRNDPCPCGSGLKYKKCLAILDSATTGNTGR